MREQAVPTVPGAEARLLTVLRDLLVTARPQQWLKNLLLYAGFVFSARTAWGWRDPETWAPMLLTASAAFALFTVAAAGGYFINDALDAERDRAHPRKRERPVAAGRLRLRAAAGAGGLLVAVAVAGSLALDLAFGAILLAYVALTAAYSLALKHLVIVDVLVIATGFALRAIAGAAAIDVPVSPWLYVCTTLGALFIAVMKRRSEVVLLERESADHRHALGEYTWSVLNQMAAVSMAATIVAYALYATSAENLPDNHSMLATLPLVLYGMFRYQLISERKPDRQAEELLLRDIPLLLSIALFGLTAFAVLAVDQ